MTSDDLDLDKMWEDYKPLCMIPIRDFRWLYKAGAGQPMALRGIAASFASIGLTVIIGRPIWNKVQKRMGMTVEDYLIKDVLPHEDLHHALYTIGEMRASILMDKKWRSGVPA
jgi:hypothetical protein